jgi:hypothetical protein
MARRFTMEYRGSVDTPRRRERGRAMGAGTLARLDGRKRVSLSAFATTDTYLITRGDHGRIILDPAVVLTAEEHALLEDAGVRASVERSRARDAEHRARRKG